MKVKNVQGIICPECGEPITEVEEVTLYECGECGTVYEDIDEAKECCKEE